MAKMRLKNGEVIELPLDKAILVMVRNPELVAPLKSGMPKPKRPLPLA